jgi:HAD superfamily hydrolase (TIGR01450 family)
MIQRLSAIRGWLFDADGTLILGDRRLSSFQPLPGAAALLERLRSKAIPYVLFTNGSTKSPAEYATALQQIGLPVEESQMLTPVSVAIDFFRRRGFRRLLVLGVEGVWRPLADAGFEVVVSPGHDENVDAVLAGWHPEFGMKDLEVASDAIWAGAPLFTLSRAPFFASAGGRALGVSGAIVAALRSITGCGATLLGKPSQHALRCASRRLDVPAAHMAVVGDDPVLDLGMALRGRAMAIGVMTGLNKAEAYAGLPPALQPHLVLAGVQELLPLIEAA